MSVPLGLRSFKGGGPIATLSGGITNVALTIPVNTIVVDEWPDTVDIGPFILTLDRGVEGLEEAVLVSGVSSTAFTVPNGGRGQNGTTAVPHSTNAQAQHTPDPASMQDVDFHVYDETRNDHTQYIEKIAYNGVGVMLYGAAPGAPTALGGPGPNQFLGENDGIPEWTDVPALPDTGWENVASFQNGWSVNGSCQYRLQGNVVRIRGSMQSGSANLTAFQLPSDMHPTLGVTTLVPYTGGPALCTVDTSGNVVVNVGATTVDFDITFTND